MPQLSYRCPSMSYRVQVFSAEEVSDTNANDYLTVLCTLCQEIHLLNKVSGELFAEEDVGGTRFALSELADLRRARRST